MRKLLTILLLVVTTSPVALAVGYDYSPQRESIGMNWNRDDMCGILTTSNTEVIHWTTTEGHNTCNMSAYGWYLTPNTNYYAYYPYSQTYSANGNPMTALPVTYVGQLQTANGSLAHLPAFDYMSAQAQSTTDACHFSFSHHASILRIECTMPGTQTLKRLTLAADSKVFTTEATINVTNGMLTPTVKQSSISLSLDNIAATKGEQLVLYIMLPPADLFGMVLTLTLTTTDDDTSSVRIQGTTVLAGHLYPVTLDMPEFVAPRRLTPPDNLAVSRPTLSHPNAAATAERVETVTAYAPDFTADTSHHFLPVADDDPATSIIEIQTPPPPHKGQGCNPSSSLGGNEGDYSISGMRISSAGKQKIYIANGKKYIKNRQ